MSWNNSFCRQLSFSSAGQCIVLFLTFPENLIFKKAGIGSGGYCWGWRTLELSSPLHFCRQDRWCSDSTALKYTVAASQHQVPYKVLHSGFSCVLWVYVFSSDRVVSCSVSEWKSYSLEQKRVKMKLLIVTAGDFFLCVAANCERFKLTSEAWEDPYLLSPPPWVRKGVIQLFSVISVLQWVGRC